MDTAAPNDGIVIRAHPTGLMYPLGAHFARGVAGPPVITIGYRPNGVAVTWKTHEVPRATPVPGSPELHHVDLALPSASREYPWSYAVVLRLQSAEAARALAMRCERIARALERTVVAEPDDLPIEPDVEAAS